MSCQSTVDKPAETQVLRRKLTKSDEDEVADGWTGDLKVDLEAAKSTDAMYCLTIFMDPVGAWGFTSEPIIGTSGARCLE